MKLSEMHAGQKGMVSTLNGDERFLSRITSIGLNEGVGFRIIKNDRKMPVLIFVRDTLLALNRRDSEKIEAKEVRA